MNVLSGGGNVNVLSRGKVMLMICPGGKVIWMCCVREGNVDALSRGKVMWMCCPGGR